MVEQAAKGTDEQLGGALVDSGDFAKGIPLLEKALAADPTNAPLALRLARGHVWAQQLAEADAAYAQLLERHPGNAVLLLEAGQVAAGRGVLERARSLLAAADKARPNDPQIRREQASLEAKFAQQAAAKPEELPAPKPLPCRAFTSQNTTSPGRVTTRSTSPCEHRQLRATTS
jgi:tetratricopeptide (TPR) repeat protein